VVTEIDFALTSDITGQIGGTPKWYKLDQNYPNPFNPKTIINYELPISSFVELKIYNLIGQEMAILVSEKQSAGSYKVSWDASGYAGGIFFYKIDTGDFHQVRKMILLR
jgi:hypothetical protein